jgi:peptidoglycan/LPS O-acetylase OafA/YrhL
MGLVVAVDIFLVISGFALTLFMLRIVEKYGVVQLLPYFITRIKRLIPALLVMLTVVVVVLVFLIPLGTGDTRQTIQVANGSVLFIANIVVDNSLGGYFGEDLFTKQNPLVHMWGLSVEEQIFIIFPFLILGALFLSRKAFPVFKKKMILIFSIFSIISFSFIYLALAGLQLPFMGPNASSAIYLSMLTRFWEFGAGSILAVLMYRNYNVKFPVASWILGVLLIAYVMITLKPGDIYPSIIALVLVAGVALILYAGSSAREASKYNPLSAKPLTFIGDISYPWFLWHMPFIVFAFALFDRNFWVGLTAGLLAGIPAFFSDRFFEKPLFYSKFLSPRKIIILFPLSILAFLSFTYIVLNDNVVNKMQPWSWTNHEVVQKGCHLPEAVPEECTWYTPGATKNLVLVGDSLAMTMGNGVIEAAKYEGWNVTVITGFNCPFTPDIVTSNPECDATSNKALDYINKNNPDAVMIVNAYTSPEVGLSNSRTINDLDKKGIKVIVSDGSTRGDSYSGKQTVLFRKGPPTRYKDPVDLGPVIVKIYSDIAKRHSSVSVSSVLCSSGKCLTAKDGVEFYSDLDHLSPQGAELLVPQLREILKKFNY